jgi:hypothetical protein
VAATSSATAIASEVDMFWLRRLKVSLTHTTTLTSSTPASVARSRPRRFSTSPAYDTPSPRGTAAMTASASAIAGTSFGWANDTASTRLAPARTRRPISSTLASVGSRTDSFWSPSRGLTSTIVTCGTGVSSPPSASPTIR